MPAGVELPNMVHPSVLDGIFHMLLACEGVETVEVPKYIERIYLSADLPTAPGSELEGYATIDERWADGTKGSVVLHVLKFESPALREMAVAIASRPHDGNLVAQLL